MSVVQYITKGDLRWDELALIAYGDISELEKLIVQNKKIPITAIIPAGTRINIPIIAISTNPTNSNILPTMEAIKTEYKVLYNQKDITENVVDKYLISLTYSDRTEGESDELVLVFENIEKLWEHNWYPRKGDTLQAWIKNMFCGIFEIDDIDYSIQPATFTIRALATSFLDKSIRTKRSAAHEDKTLFQIVNFYAQKNGFKLLANIRKNIVIKRETQNNETDLSFLKKLSDKYGYVFSVRGDQLIFYDIFALESSEPVLELAPGDLKSGSFRDKVSELYKSAEVSYHNPKSGEVVTATTEADEDNGSSDVLQIRKKVENEGQAEEMAKSELYKKNSEKVTCSLSMIGNENIVSGINFRMLDAGNFEGIYHVKSSTHGITKDGGYVTSFDAKKIKDA